MSNENKNPDTIDIDMDKSFEDINNEMLRNANKKNIMLILVSIIGLMLMTIIKYGMVKKTFIGVSWIIIVGITVLINNKIIKKDDMKAVGILLTAGIATPIYSFLVGGTPLALTFTFVLLGMSSMYFNPKITLYSSVPLCFIMMVLAIIFPYSIEGQGGTVAEAVAKVIIYSISVILMRQAIGMGEKYNSESYAGLEKVRDNRRKTKEVENNLTSIVEECNTLVDGLMEQSENINSATQNIYKEDEKASKGMEKINTTKITVRELIDENKELSKSLIDSYNEVATVVEDGLDRTETTKVIINNMVDKIKATSKISNDLIENMEEIGLVLAEIDEIFSQTKLLALNASIEAARAGTMGIGFDVVADEIRSLSDQSAKASNNVKATINTLENTTQEVVQKISEVAEVSKEGYVQISSITDILERVEDTSNSIEKIIKDEDNIIIKIDKAFNEIANQLKNFEDLSMSNSRELEQIQTDVIEQNKSVKNLGEKMIYVESLANELR